MKRDRWNFLLFVSASVFQCIFFRFFNFEMVPYAFITGIRDFDYLQCLAICFPVFFIILLFSDYYSFHMENYGRLLLVRNCNINTMILKLFFRMAVGMAGITMAQLGINYIFFNRCRLDETAMFRCSIVYFCIVYFLLCIGFFLAAFFKDSVVNLVVNIVLLLSCFAHGLIKIQWMKMVLFIGKIININQIIWKQSGFQTVLCEILPILFLTAGIYVAVAFRCRKKDIF